MSIGTADSEVWMDSTSTEGTGQHRSAVVSNMQPDKCKMMRDNDGFVRATGPELRKQPLVTDQLDRVMEADAPALEAGG